MEIMNLCEAEYRKIKRVCVCMSVCTRESILNKAHKCQLTAPSTQEACVES